jgi:hypothetical protein
VVTRPGRTDAIRVPREATSPDRGRAHSVRVSARQGARRHERPFIRRTYRKDIEMRTIHRSHTAVLAITTVLGLVLLAPLAVNAEEQTLAMAPASPSGEETSGYASVETSGVLAMQRALGAGDLGSGQEEALTAVVTASMAEDELSDDDALAAKRAELFAQFRTIELSLSRHLGAEHSGALSCNAGS